MNLKSFTNPWDKTKTYFNNINDEQLEFMIKEGFLHEPYSLICYAGLKNSGASTMCYRKHIHDDTYEICCCITDDGIAVDIDYSCGGNVNNDTWLFEDYSFEEAWNNMVDKVTNWL